MSSNPLGMEDKDVPNEEKTSPSTKNSIFTPKEEEILIKHFQNKQMNQFLEIIVSKALDKTPDIKNKAWKPSMDFLIELFDNHTIKEQISKIPDENKEINIANLLYLALTVRVPYFSLQ